MHISSKKFGNINYYHFCLKNNFDIAKLRGIFLEYYVINHLHYHQNDLEVLKIIDQNNANNNYYNGGTVYSIVEYTKK